MTIFKNGPFTLHSGSVSNYKIDCDDYTEEDWETIAGMIDRNFPICFSHVYGVPRGGVPLANALQKYCTPTGMAHLIVDDVLTTGRSMEEARIHVSKTANSPKDIFGVVLYARDEAPRWIFPIFQMKAWIES